MPVTQNSTLPEGMRERAFALRNGVTGQVARFGRGTDFPCSNYTFPAVDFSGQMHSIHGHNATIPGILDSQADFFEAEFGVLEPGAADKLSRFQATWALTARDRPTLGSHELYYILGGRPRLMYGVPSRIAPKYNGYKTSFHEGVLRFAVTSPYFYDSSQSVSQGPDHTVSLTGTGNIQKELDITTNTEVPTPLSIDFRSSSTTVGVKYHLEIMNKPSPDSPDFSWRTVLLAEGSKGQIQIFNHPGKAVSYYRAATHTGGGYTSSGADFLMPNSPAFRQVTINPGDVKIRITASNLVSVGQSVYTILSWRDCYAGA